MDIQVQQTAKERLDKFISKQRVAMYKPIQVAEILYRVRLGKDGMSVEALGDVEQYRNASKKWRDIVSRRLIGQVSTSSQKFQDNLFESNAIPPDFLRTLAEINNAFEGIIERYIYQSFYDRQKSIILLRNYLRECIQGSHQFQLVKFLSLFRRDKGIRRSIDKAYEIVVYALFSTLITHLQIRIEISTNPQKASLLREFEEFTRILLGLDSHTPRRVVEGRLYRAGVANAADRGLDIWANFGPAVQVKHISLSEEFAEEVASEVHAEEIVIVCKDAERNVIERVCQQLGQRLRGIIQESQLVAWYERALAPNREDGLGETLLNSLIREFDLEFPFSETFHEFYEERGYDKISKPEVECPFWKPDE